MRRHIRKLIPLGVLATLAAYAGAMVGGLDWGFAASQARPTNQQPPTIQGTAEVGQTLTAREGTWTGSPTTFLYAWRRCDADGGSCSTISGATEKTYVLKNPDRDNTLRVVVGAQNADGRTNATSVPTAVVRAATAPPAATPCDKNPVVATELKLPELLSIAGQQVSPSVIGGSTETIVARFRITACNGKPVQGALVYVTAVPYNQFTVPQEQSTGATVGPSSG